jgi:Cof subfamily protein (haloacid dehalogenase superfamily)
MSFPYRWFITDVDGTLLDPDNEIPDANRAALAELKRAGVPVVLATGRRWTTLKRVLDRLDLWDLTDYAIANNGAIIKDLRARELLHHEGFAPGAVTAAAAVLDTFGWDPLALTYVPDGGPDVYHRRLSLRNGDFAAKNEGHTMLVNDFAELEARTVVELILLGTEADLSRAQAALAPLDLETALIKNTFYADYMLEVTPRGVSKLSGALRLGGRLGLSPAEAVAVGDSANDLPLLREVGRAVAMAHAPDPVRAAAHETGTVAEAARRWFASDASNSPTA